MAASQTEVVNLALTKLEQDRIVSINDDTETARVMRSLWDLTRDTVLAAHPWKFAIVRAELASLADAPLFGFSLQYALPEPCLKLVQVGEDWTFYTGELEAFALEGGKILTDIDAPLRVRYVQRVENVGLWPPLFCRAVAMQLAADAAGKLTGSGSKAQNALGEYEMAVRTAKRHSAIERPPQLRTEGAWLKARG